MDNSNKRMCYCDDLRKQDPDYFKRQEIPDGYCGKCEKCGEFGHMRHHPGAVPYTGSWCDRHYQILKWTHPLSLPGIFVWIAIIFLLICVFND